jgi:transposase
MTLKDRMWEYPNCKVIHDRDENAAKNLMKLAVSSTVTVCRVTSVGIGISNNIN